MSFRKSILFFLFFFACRFILSAQQPIVNVNSVPGWYIDTTYGAIYHLNLDGEFEGFGGDEMKRGKWKMKDDSLFMSNEWYYSEPFSMCCVGGCDEFIPFMDTMIYSSGQLYELYDLKDSNDVSAIPWIPGSKNQFSQRVNFIIDGTCKKFGDDMFHPKEIDISHAAGRYSWSGFRGHESLRLKKSGKFVLKSRSSATTDENWTDKGHWRISGDTLILKVKISKQIGFETPYVPGMRYFYFNKSYWMVDKVKSENEMTKKLYPLTRKQFRKYGK
jgi:hypothetical protein